MNKFLFITLLAIVVSACSTEDKVKDTVTSYLKSQMKNPDSFKIESIEIRKDTIPEYLSNDMLNLADEATDAFNEYNRYKDMGFLFADELRESAQNWYEKGKALQEAYNAAVNTDEPTVEYVAYVNCSGTNALGGTISNKVIVIVDKNNPKNILGSFNIDNDFILKYVAIKIIGTDWKYKPKTNKYGKYETDGLSYFEQFIIRDAERQ